MPGEPQIHGDDRWVSPGYFATLKIPLLTGRTFTDQDRAGSEPVAMIDENLAKQYWPGENPIGRRMRQAGPPSAAAPPWCTIVGVVGNVRQMDLSGDSTKGVYYFPLFQKTLGYGTIAIRSAGNPLHLAAAMRAAIRSVDPSQPVFDMKSMDQFVAKPSACGASR